MAAITSLWFRRNASQRLSGSGSLGARFIQREIVLSQRSKPSIRSSPWMRGAPQVGFSTTIRKINSRTSFGVGFLPTRVLTLEVSFQYTRKPARCQRSTVSGVTTRRACFHPDQIRLAATQNSLSNGLRPGRRRRRFNTTSCWRNARFSRRRLRRARKKRTTIPRHTLLNRTMARSCNRTPAAMLLISQSAGVLANDRNVWTSGIGYVRSESRKNFLRENLKNELD